MNFPPERKSENRPMSAMRTPFLRLAAALAIVNIGLAGAPLLASPCTADAGRQQVRAAGTDYERVPFTATAVDRADPRFAWTNEWGNIVLQRGATLSSADPALYQIARYTPVFSTGQTRSGSYLLFVPVSLSDRTLVDIRLAAEPELGGGPPIGTSLSEPRPSDGPAIPGYRFQMAEPLPAGGNSYLGLWRRAGRSGARTLLVHFSRPNARHDYVTRIVGRSDLAFSLISRIDTLHGGDWSFTLFTEADCPGHIAMLSYLWHLYIPVTAPPPAR
jgi:hypothetical protein